MADKKTKQPAQVVIVNEQGKEISVSPAVAKNFLKNGWKEK